MLPLSAKDVLRYTPDVTGDRPNPPTYLLSVPTKRTRAIYERDCVAEGIVQHSINDQIDAMIADLRELAPEGVDGMIARLEEARDAGIGALEVEERQTIDTIGLEVQRFPGRYARIAADRAFYNAWAPYIACRHFLVGWEDLDLPFVRKGDRVPEDLLDQLPDADVNGAGWHVLMHTYLSAAQRKNSASPSQSLDSPEPSTATTP